MPMGTGRHRDGRRSPVDNDDGYTDRFVSRSGAGVARSEAGTMLARGECD
jgi:hypothetical protein